MKQYIIQRYLDDIKMWTRYSYCYEINSTSNQGMAYANHGYDYWMQNVYFKDNHPLMKLAD